MGQAAGREKGLDDIGTFLPKNDSGSMPVREVLLGKRQLEVLTIGPKDTVFDALSRMAEKNVGALVVVDGGRTASFTWVLSTATALGSSASYIDAITCAAYLQETASQPDVPRNRQLAFG